MVLPEPSGHTIGNPDHANPEEAEENDLQCSFMKMIKKSLKEEMKNSLKEMDEKTNKNLEEINKSLKKTQEKNNHRP